MRNLGGPDEGFGRFYEYFGAGYESFGRSMRDLEDKPLIWSKFFSMRDLDSFVADEAVGSCYFSSKCLLFG